MPKDGVRKWYIGAVSGWLRGGAKGVCGVRRGLRRGVNVGLGSVLG